MQSGLVYGHMGMVDYIVKKMKKELQEYSRDDSIEVKVIATGGLATMIDSGIDCIDHVDKMLTLEGLELIYEKNRKPRRIESKAELKAEKERCEYGEATV